MRAALPALVGLAATAAAATAIASAPKTPGTAALPPDHWFAPTSVWNSAVPAGAPLDPRSAALVQSLTDLSAHTTINTTRYSTPVYRVGPHQPRVAVTLRDNRAPLLTKALSSVPLPANARPSDGTDGNAIVYQRSTDTEWEFWRLRAQGGAFTAAWGGRVEHMSSDPGYFRDLRAGGHIVERKIWGAAASRLNKLGGLITAAELRRGVIPHAIAIAIPHPLRGQFALPAQDTDGKGNGPGDIPEGAHFRLDPAVDVDALNLPPVTRTLAVAAQRYGLIVNNGAGAVAFYVEDPRTFARDPYPKLFGAASPHELAAAFPFSSLQLLRMDLRRRPGA